MTLKANNIHICAKLNKLLVQDPGSPLQIGVTVPVHRFGCPPQSIWRPCCACISSCIHSAFSSRCDGHLSVGPQISQIQKKPVNIWTQCKRAGSVDGVADHCTLLTHPVSSCFVLAVCYASRQEVFCCCVHGNSKLKEWKEAPGIKCFKMEWKYATKRFLKRV